MSNTTQSNLRCQACQKQYPNMKNLRLWKSKRALTQHMRKSHTLQDVGGLI